MQGDGALGKLSFRKDLGIQTPSRKSAFGPATERPEGFEALRQAQGDMVGAQGDIVARGAA